MNTQQLECFVSLVSTLNYARTAEQLALSQPAVSRQIQSLEEELGAKLFNRTTRSVSLSQVGSMFLPEAQQMLNVYYHSMEWVKNFHSDARTILRIGYADSHCTSLIGEILQDVIAVNENISPELLMDQTDANLHRLEVNQLDVVIGMKDARFSDESIGFLKLNDDGFVCAANHEHPLAREYGKRGYVCSAELWPYRQIINIPPYLLKNIFSGRMHIVPVNENLTNTICSSTNEAYSLAIAGAGFTLVPEHLAVGDERLAFMRWEETPRAEMGIYYRKKSVGNKNSQVALFLNIAKEKYPRK